MVSSIEPLQDGPKGRVPEVRNAYRFLRGARDSVAGIVSVTHRLSDARRNANESTVGRLAREEVDLLRSAIVLTSSGVDASMQRIIWDAGRLLIPIANSSARAAYVQHLRQALSGREQVDEPLRSAVVSAEPADALLTYYLGIKTRASFQGSGDLKKRVRNVLGVPSSAVSDADLESLDPFFRARNNIVHSMDYERPREAGRTARVHRSADDVAAMCNNAFRVTSDLLHAVADVILASQPRP